MPRKSKLDEIDRRREAIARRRQNEKPAPIVAITKRVTSRLFYIGHRADGSQVLLMTPQALKLHPGALDLPEGQRINVKPTPNP